MTKSELKQTITELRAQRVHAAKIAEMLNERGVTTPKGKRWTRSHINTFAMNAGLKRLRKKFKRAKSVKATVTKPAPVKKHTGELQLTRTLLTILQHPGISDSVKGELFTELCGHAKLSNT